MHARNQEQVLGRLLAMSAFSGQALMVLGVLVLLGWIFDLGALKSLHPSYVSMKANTAAGFVFCGLALWLISQRAKFKNSLVVARVAAMVAGGIGAVSLIEYFLGIQSGFDNLFFTESPDAVGTFLPGRMAVNSAIGFLVAGAVLMLLTYEDQRPVVWAQLGAFFLALLSLLPLFGYGFAMDALYGLSDYTRMALHTALGFLVLGVGMLFNRPARGAMAIFSKPGYGGYLARQLLPLVIVTTLMLVLIWVMAERLGWQELSSDISLFFVLLLATSVLLIWKTATSINKLDSRREELAKQASDWQYLMQYVIRHDLSAIAVHDKDLRYVFVSERYLSDYGVKEKDIIGKHHYEVFPDIPQKWRDVHQRALLGEVISKEEDFFVRADGHVEHTRWACRPWHHRDGKIGGIILYTEVITKRKKSEAAAETNRRLLTSLMDNAFSLIYVADKNGRILMMNEPMKKLMGVDEVPEGGILREQFMDKQVAMQHQQNDQDVIKKRSTVVFEEINIEADGIHHYLTTKVPLTDNKGDIHAVCGISLDITRRKQMEEEIRILNTRLYDLVAAIKELSTARSNEAIQEIMAKFARKLAGSDGATFVFKDKDHCHYVHEDAMEPLFAGNKYPLEQCITGWVMINKQAAVIEDIFKDDRIPHEVYKKTFVKSLAAFPVNQSEPRAAVGVYWGKHYLPDQTEQQLLQSLADAAAIALENVDLLEDLEQRVSRRTEQLEAANKELESFSYSVSHDLRSPLRAIDGFSRILLEDHVARMDDDAKRLFQVVRDNTQQMGRLIDDLLAFSRLSRKEVSKEVIDVQTLVSSIYHELTTPEMRKKIQFTVGDICSTKGDASMIRQVWRNLLSNALKFTREHEAPHIRISCERENNFCIYAVEDNGVGFEMQYVDKIFGVFQRLHSAREFEGTGVGLAIVQRVIHKHGGKVWTEGQVNKGAKFYFSLPLIENEH